MITVEERETIRRAYYLEGKSKRQIALEYAYRHAMEYSAVFWIGAETEEQTVSGLLRIAEVLQLPGRDDEDQQRVVAAVQGWLCTHGQWLLIWDNVEDLAMLDRFLPAAWSGVLLITTRCQTLGALARDLDLLPMEHEEGMVFLLRRAKVLEPEAGSQQVQRMVVRRPIYSLLSRQPEEQTLSMHRLVQAVLLDGMTEAEREQWGRRVTEAIDAVLPDVEQAKEYATWKQCERLLPHALLCLHRAGATEKSLALAALAYKVAQYLREHGRHAEAEALYQRALHIREQALGSDHLQVTYPFNNLANLFREQAKYAEAEALYQRALSVREQHLGQHHPETAQTLHDLSIFQQKQSNLNEALSLAQRALKIRSQSLGDAHPKTVATRTLYAQLLM